MHFLRITCRCSSKLSVLLVLLCMLSVQQTLAQQARFGAVGRYVQSLLNDTTDAAQPRFLVYPTIAYTPETNWEFGLSSLYVYHAGRDTVNRLSEISAFAFYTLENQYGLWLDHALYSDQDQWFFLGRMRYQSFPLLFYGIGPDAASEFLAKVDGNFFLLKERVMYQLRPSVYAGPQVDFQQLSQVSFNPAEADNPVDPPLGGFGSSNLGLGFGVVYDNRHNVLNVRHGMFSELAVLRYDDTWGSDFSFTNVISDNRFFMPVNSRDVLAAQLFGQFTMAGKAPFNQLALMGGESLMRGYYLGRYRDDNLIAGQVEYRLLPLPFAKRWGAAAFLGAGQVFGREDSFNFSQSLPAGGAGVRFLLFPTKDIWVRFDVAFTEEGQGYYIFIGEAF